MESHRLKSWTQANCEDIQITVRRYFILVVRQQQPQPSSSVNTSVSIVNSINSTVNSNITPIPTSKPLSKPASTSYPIQQTKYQVQQPILPQSHQASADENFSDVDNTLDYADINLDNYPIPAPVPVQEAAPQPKGLPRSISEGFPVNKNWNPPPRRF